MHTKKIRSLISLALILSVLTAVVCIQPSPALAQTNTEKRNEYQKKANALKEEIAALENEKAETEKIKEKVDEQIENTELQIMEVQSRLDEINSELEVITAELDAKNAELEQNKDIFKQRLRAMYMSGSTSGDLQFLLGADDVADYLSMSELSRSISRHDEVLMEEIVEALATIEEDRAVVEVKKEAQDAVKRELAATQAELGEQVAKLENLIAQSDAKIDDAKSELEEYNAAIDELNEKINAATQNSYNSNIQYSGGQFAWPVPGYYFLSSPYGWRWGRLHAGVDISGGGIMGKPIVAAADGQVILADYNSGGYGNYVMINHGSNGGNSYVTLYGHMTYYIVSSGQSVSKGQTIGYVGSTGRSTGPHLHFEIRVNGSAYNPMEYY